MLKLIKWFKNHIFGALTLFLLVFIPLYPKIPLIDIKNTWVYIRVEDFLVLFSLILWIGLLFKNKVTLKTPLTLPILLFWLAGFLATLHGVLIIFPSMGTVFGNVSLLSFIRRIEYMSVFFLSYTAVREKLPLSNFIVALTVTTLSVCLYGFGQKYFAFPAYLTMNEEVAKGVPITLSSLSRISSTFGGHYDLAAYLVLVLPILVSLAIGIRHISAKFFLLIVVFLGCVVMLFTVSRISLFALSISLFLVMFFHFRQKSLWLIPIVLLAAVVALSVSPRILDRFKSTVKSINVLVHAPSGTPMGHVKEVDKSYFENKEIWQRFYVSMSDIHSKSSPSAALLIPSDALPDRVVLLEEPAALTGEDLPSGTGYINLELSPVTRRLGSFLYEPSHQTATEAAHVHVINGEYLVKKAYAYDVSFTTRFQGEWPNALSAFHRNILFGSGYGSVSLAIDNSYLRMLAEVGLLGFVLFLSIFLVFGVYTVSHLPTVSNPVHRSFVLGFVAGFVGLSVNALFIDVFEASKVAFVLWLLMGIVVGVLSFETRSDLNFFAVVKKSVLSVPAVLIYLCIAAFVLYGQMMRNYFVGDDFTWFRWVASHEGGLSLIRFFTDSDGFFYRPGAKLYYYLMYNGFWFNQSVYHFVSILFHFINAVLVFVLGRKVFFARGPAALSAMLFVVLSAFTEAVFWVSATGILISSSFILLSLICFILWKEGRARSTLHLTVITSLLAMMFHEIGIVTPLLYIGYEIVFFRNTLKKPAWHRTSSNWLLLAPVPLYLLVRYVSGSHWFSGDYSYNLIKLPLNGIGNLLGYVLTAVLGTPALPIYEILRVSLREQWIAVLFITALLGFGVYWKRKVLGSWIGNSKLNVLIFGFVFMVVALLPFLGLGNIAPRYGYLSAVGFIYALVYVFYRFYTFLLPNGREIAVPAMAVIVGSFVLLHVVGVQQQHRDWFEAGERVTRFITTLESKYEDQWSNGPMQFHFVNIPIRHREAWVFPVGINDILWFVLGNPNVQVYSWATGEDALNAVDVQSKRQKVFLFDNDGNVTEIKKPHFVAP